MPKKMIDISDETVFSKIYMIRGQKVMLDRDLAELYGVETRRLKEQVRRNLMRFPADFMFEMTNEELADWRSQFATSNFDKQGLRHAPFCFTEQGLTMLSCILNSERAILMNIQIIRIFTRLRQMLVENKELLIEIEKIKGMLNNQDKNMEIIFQRLDELLIHKEIFELPLAKDMNHVGFKKW